MKRYWTYGIFLIAAPLVHAQDTSWTQNDAMLTYFQAANAIQEHALQPLDYPDIIHTSLKLLLEKQDPYSTLLTPEQFGRFRSMGEDADGRIGVELARSRTGAFSCIPYPGSPAATAGIEDGDELRAVDGQPVTGQSLEMVGALIRGKPGSSVTLLVRGEAGEDRAVTIERNRLQPQSVSAVLREGVDVLRIYAFTSSTPKELQSAVQSLPTGVPIVIDLRGCPGGNLFDAVDAARLFLAPGQTIVDVRNRTGIATYRTDRPPACPDRLLWILQDEATASAAEVFIAAMVDNGRGQSIGRTSFGKGRTQRIIALMDGSAMLLTDGELMPPSGHPFDGQGLRPTVPVEQGPILPRLVQELRP